MTILLTYFVLFSSTQFLKKSKKPKIHDGRDSRNYEPTPDAGGWPLCLKETRSRDISYMLENEFQSQVQWGIQKWLKCT